MRRGEMSFYEMTKNETYKLISNSISGLNTKTLQNMDTLKSRNPLSCIESKGESPAVKTLNTCRVIRGLLEVSERQTTQSEL